MELMDGAQEHTSKGRGYDAMGGTVLEMIAATEQIDPSAGGPQPTPPVPTQTTTRSGEGYAQIADDDLTDHLYE